MNDDSRHAADDPTAVWTDESIQEALGEVPVSDSGPATEGAGQSKKVSVDLAMLSDAPGDGEPHKGLGPVATWSITLVIAVVVGVGMFMLIRALRG